MKCIFCKQTIHTGDETYQGEAHQECHDKAMEYKEEIESAQKEADETDL